MLQWLAVEQKLSGPPRFRARRRVPAHGASETHATGAKERGPSCKGRPRRDKLFSGFFGSLLEVLAGLDDDRRVSILNPNVVHLPKSRPGTPINNFWKFSIHNLLVA